MHEETAVSPLRPDPPQLTDMVMSPSKSTDGLAIGFMIFPPAFFFPISLTHSTALEVSFPEIRDVRFATNDIPHRPDGANLDSN